MRYLSLQLEYFISCPQIILEISWNNSAECLRTWKKYISYFENMFLPFLSPLGNTQLMGPTAVRGGTYTRNKNREYFHQNLVTTLLLSHLKFTPNIIPSQVVRGVPHTLRHSSCHIDGGLFSYYVNTQLRSKPKRQKKVNNNINNNHQLKNK